MRQKMDEAQRRAIKENILKCTKSIVEREGFEGISIRKVAKLAGYTPGSIYQYFDNKDTLIRELIEEGYGKIIEATMKDLDENLTIEKQIRQRFTYYIKAALKMPDYYKAVMINQDSKIVEMTSILNNNLTTKKKAVNILEELIKKGMEVGEFNQGDSKLIARIIWTANFGLTLRLIIENQKEEELIEDLIEEQFNLLFNGLRKKGE